MFSNRRSSKISVKCERAVIPQYPAYPFIYGEPSSPATVIQTRENSCRISSLPISSQSENQSSGIGDELLLGTITTRES